VISGLFSSVIDSREGGKVAGSGDFSLLESRWSSVSAVREDREAGMGSVMEADDRSLCEIVIK
jgi:hypothetical protein